MVEYEVRNLVIQTDDEDVEEVYLLLLMHRQEELAEAAARWFLIKFDFENIPELDLRRKFRFHKNDIPFNTLCLL